MGFDRLTYPSLLPGNQLIAPFCFNLAHNDRIYIDMNETVIEPNNSVNSVFGSTSTTLQAI